MIEYCYTVKSNYTEMDRWGPKNNRISDEIWSRLLGIGFPNFPGEHAFGPL